VTRRILRTVIPVDDQWHTLELHGPIVHVATRGIDHVEVWFEDDPSVAEATRAFRAYGTGMAVEGRHVGTVITPGGGLVWHLMERTT
jgi:hypothetical protein